MGRMDRVKEELRKTTLKLSAAIEKSHQEGKIPADYSLGFANAVIFFEHMLSLRDGGPKFFDRTTSIGTLPVPVALRSPQEVATEYNTVAAIARLKEQNFLQEQIITQARGVAASMEAMEEEEEPNEKTVKGFSIGLASMKKSIEEFDRVMTQHEELLHAQAQNRNKENAEGEPVRECAPQGSSYEPKASRGLSVCQVAEGQRPCATPTNPAEDLANGE